MLVVWLGKWALNDYAIKYPYMCTLSSGNISGDLEEKMVTHGDSQQQNLVASSEVDWNTYTA